MKKALIMFVTLLALSPAAFAQEECDASQSDICRGIVSFYDFEELSDYGRENLLTGGILEEKGGTDVGQAAGKIESYAADFDGTGGFATPYGSFGSGPWTVAVWIYPTDDTARKILVAQDAEGNGTVIKRNATKTITATVTSSIGREVGSVTSSTTALKNQWTLIVVTHPTETLQGSEKLKVSVGGGSYTTTTLSSFIGPAGSYSTGEAGLQVGSNWLGRMDGLLILRRSWNDSSQELADYYASGSGVAYPFY